MTVAEGEPVTVAGVARRYDISEAALAKVFQQLVRAGLSHGTRGVGGGYRLARSPSEITVIDVIDAFESIPAADRCLLDDSGRPCRDLGACRLKRLFDEVDGVARATFASTTLETLVGRGS
jgi:Rrf2 family iron-sulfur cluster assembly transcriptional regulator